MEIRKPVINILTHILDDDEDFCLIIDSILKNYSEIEYKMYSTLNEFIIAVKEDKNISVIDYNLKEKINGLELSKIILEKNPSSYVIMMSSQSDINVVTEFYDNSGFRYVNKISSNFSEKLIKAIQDAKSSIQRQLDYYFNVIEKFNNTQETFNNVRNTLNSPRNSQS